MTIDTSPEAIAALRENARHAGKEGAGTHRNAGDAGRVAALWIEAKGGIARAEDPTAATIARLTAERDAAWNNAIRAAAECSDPTSYQAHHASVRRRVQRAILALLKPEEKA